MGGLFRQGGEAQRICWVKIIMGKTKWARHESRAQGGQGGGVWGSDRSQNKILYFAAGRKITDALLTHFRGRGPLGRRPTWDNQWESQPSKESVIWPWKKGETRGRKKKDGESKKRLIAKKPYFSLKWRLLSHFQRLGKKGLEQGKKRSADQGKNLTGETNARPIEEDGMGEQRGKRKTGEGSSGVQRKNKESTRDGAMVSPKGWEDPEGEVQPILDHGGGKKKESQN